MQKKTNKNPQSWESVMKMVEEEFQRELRELKRLVKIWRDNESNVKQQCNEGAILMKYAYYLQQANNSDRLKGLFYVKPIMYEQQMKGIKSEKQIFLGISFIDQKEWKISFSKKILKKLNYLSEASIIDIFFKIYMTANGYLSLTEGKQNYFSPYQRPNKLSLQYFTQQIDINHETYFLLLTFGVHRVPHYDFNNANGSKIEYFEYNMVIVAEDIISQSKFYHEKYMKALLDDIEDYYQESPRTCYDRKEIKIDLENMNDKKNYFHKKRDNKQIGAIIYPTIFRRHFPDYLEAQNYNFLLEKFTDYGIRAAFLEASQMNLEKQSIIDCELQQQDCQNQQILELQLETIRNQNFQFQNHSKILHYLKQIPNFKYLLTRQQKEVLIRNGNLIIVGRSGTGKTTCAMLRLYGIELLVKMNEFSSLKRQGRVETTKQRCAIMLLNEIKLLKNIFLTFSGRLIDQIKKQYDDMAFQIHQKHAQKCQICKQTLKQKKPEDEQEDPLDKIKRQQEEQQRKVISLSSISNDDFPGFFTIENFIRIIDKTVPRPFFSHKKQHQNDKNNTIIKYAFINRYQYGPKSINHTQTVEAVYVDYNFFANQIWENLPKELTKSSKEFCLLTPAIVWSEIFSILKGSLKSYLCPGGYISLKMYMEEHQSIFQKQPEKMFEYKQRVYKILKSYIHWCRSERSAYDLMDVVSHNLRQIEFYGYSGPKINYMFVDEVQDLTASTTFLISKMVLNNIFYCGDTAQAITKGVSFRFEDLKFIFNKQYCKNALKLNQPEDIIYLTVNFRSHHFILQLANTIVSSLEELFPNSITKISKEKSDLIGPRPFILLNQDVWTLFQLICGPPQIKKEDICGEKNLREIIKQSEKKERQKFQKKRGKKMKNRQKEMEEVDEEEFYGEEEENSSDEQQTRKFNSEQIIIVRNLEEKRRLPARLKRGIVLIPQSAKGLEFDEVILYNFFNSCPIFDKWNSLLEHLDSKEFYEDQKKFEDELSRRSRQQNDKEQPLPIEIKKMLGYDQGRKQYKIWNIKGKESIKGVNINLYLELSSQLKILYTVITRARSVFAIFDEKIPKNLFNLWKDMNLVTVVDESNVLQCHSQINQYVYVKQKHKKYVNQDRHWFKAGSQMLARKDYDNAKKCFKNIKRYDLVDRIEALELQIKAENIVYRANNGLKNIQNLERDQRKIKKIILQREKKDALKYYLNAGKIYGKYSRNNDAAEAYFKAEEYQFALKYFNQTNNLEKIAICSKKLKRYRQAIQAFKAVGDIESIVECYIEEKSWIQLFEMLLNNPEYIHKFKQLNQRALDCVKEVLFSKVRGEDIKKAQEDYKFFYGLEMEKNKESKQSFQSNQLSLQITRIVLESEYQNLKAMNKQLEGQMSIYEKSQQAYHTIKAKLQILLEQQAKIIEKIGAINKQKEILLKIQKEIKGKLSIYEKQYLEEELQFLADYHELSKELENISQQKGKTYENGQLLQLQLNALHGQIFQLQNKVNYAKHEFESYSERYQFKKSQMGVLVLSKKILQVIKKYQIHSKAVTNPKTNSKKAIDAYDNNKSQLLSVSDVSEMSEIWDFIQDNIGGFHLHPPQKKQLLQQIQQILNLSLKIIENVAQETYRPYHHKYIQQKLLKFLVQQSTSEAYHNIVSLRTCNRVGQNLCCLLMCDSYKDFICLSPKYILGYLAGFSNNFKLNRYFDNQIFQIESGQKWKLKKDEDNDQLQQNQLSEVGKFLVSLNNDGLRHKVPRLAFENRFYYETILSQVCFGLVLQGYFQQVLIFCQLGQACKLSYIYSSYGKLLHYIKMIAQRMNVKNLKDKNFLFTQDERILHYFPEATVLNIFSIQNIFYAYDECQLEPFLSKKKTEYSYDIDQDVVTDLYDRYADIKIKQMIKQNQTVNNKIRLLREQNNRYQEQKRQKTSQKNSLDIIIRNSIKDLQINRSELQLILNEKKSSLEKAEYVKAKAEKRANDSIIPTKQKKQYQLELSNMLFQFDELIKKGKIQQSQRLRIKRMNLDQEYKQKRQQEKEAYQNLQRVKVRQKQKQAEVDSIRRELSQIHQQILQKQRIINQMTPKQIQQEFNKCIIQNNKSIENLNLQIHRQVFIKDQTDKKQAVVQLLMSEMRREMHKQSIQNLCRTNMSKIQKSSNIPKSPHFKFLTLYMKGQLGQKNKEIALSSIAEIYYKILKDGISIDKLLSVQEQKQISDIKICNIIILYLSYICNNSFRQHLNDSLHIAFLTFNQNSNKRNSLKQQMNNCQNIIQFNQYQISRMPRDQRNNKNRNYYQLSNQLEKARIQLPELKELFEQASVYLIDPYIIRNEFLNTIYGKIKKLDLSQIHLMQLLFGFFQCRIIKDCQLLDFLANQYVLVRHNSIVIKEMQEEKRNYFAYYFDNKNQTILCRFQDIQNIILGFIESKHQEVTSTGVSMENKQKKQKTKNRYINRQILGFTNKPETEESRQLLELTQFINYNHKRQVKDVYDSSFIGSALMKDIKAAKKVALEYYLKNKFSDTDEYFFASHQIRQYYFLQKVLSSTQSFNYELLKDIRKKKDLLKKEFQIHVQQKINKKGIK